MSQRPLHKTFSQAQFEELFRTHFQYLCNFAQQYVKDADTAQDLTQKVFITLWEKRADIDPQQSIKSYLFRSVKNRCLNYLRDTKTYRSKILDIDCGDIEVSIEEEPFAEGELKKRIEIALGKLPDKCRQVFEMSRNQGMKYKEISEELGIAQKTVEAHMSKAIRHLREQLKDYVWVLIFLIENG